MSKFSARILEEHAHKGVSRVLSIFAHTSDAVDDQLDGAITKILTKEVVFDQARIVGLQECIAQASRWLSDESSSVRGRLDLATYDFKDNSRLITFNDASGAFTSHYLDGRPDSQTAQTILSEQRLSLLGMFKDSNAFTNATKGFHYIKPSGKHVNGFLRTANVLESGSNISTIAFWLLPYLWNKPIEQIVVDTSGISAIAYSLAYMTHQRGGINKLPTVISHQSYGGLEELVVQDPDKTLFLISASTSGELRQRLIQKGAKEENVVTLFFLGEDQANAGLLLCNLTKHEIQNPHGFDSLKNYSSAECPDCKLLSFPVRLSGDQFTLEQPVIDQVFISREDLSSVQKERIDLLAGTGVFKVFRNLQQRQLEIFLDVSEIFTAESNKNLALIALKEKWLGIVRRSLPVHLKRIIYAGYPYSQELGTLSEDILKQYQNIQASILIGSRDLRQGETAEGTASLVIAGCFDDAHELMGINRDLRIIQPKGNTTYIAPIFRASSKAERNRVRSNLTFGENGPNTFNLYSLIELDLPECAKDHSWKIELEYLNKLISWADINDKPVPIEITQRIQFLQNAPSTGISDQLFWQDPKGRELRIRPDFALINNDGGSREISQADVFVVVSALLLCLRNGVKNKPRLSQKLFEWTVLSPDNFQRFNDGAIQAALLRAAHNKELVYLANETFSIRLKEMILAQIQNINDGHEDGEALMEFLLAMFTKRLVLLPSDKLEICQAVTKTSLPDHFRLVAEYLLNES